MANLRIVDIIPQPQSGEIVGAASPVLGVNPVDPAQIIAGDITRGAVRDSRLPNWISTDGGASWASYGNLGEFSFHRERNDPVLGYRDHSLADRSISWTSDGSSPLTAAVALDIEVEGFIDAFAMVDVYAGTVTGGHFDRLLGNAFYDFSPSTPAYPEIATGPGNHVYVAFSADTLPKISVSSDGGRNYPVRVTLEASVQNQFTPVELAVNGNTVYAAYTHLDSAVGDGSFRYFGKVVVVRSDNAGADQFQALGGGTQVAAPITPFASPNSGLSLGPDGIGGDLALAVDPNNAQRVVVAYLDAPGSPDAGKVQIVVAESTDGGVTWATKFTTPAAVRSGEQALAIRADGTIGLLYVAYDGTVSHHLLTTSDDFATTTDTVLATEAGTTPRNGGGGELTSIGNSFYGVFNAWNADDGSHVTFAPNTSFQRNFIGTPGTSSFQLIDTSGNPVSSSIDTFFFSAAGSIPNSVDYGDATGGVYVDLAAQFTEHAPAGQGWSGGPGSVTPASTDPLADIWNATGSGLDDLLMGGTSSDALSGEAGADQLYGGDGADQLIGGAGSDVLVGGPGADTLFGGGDADYLLIDAADTGIAGGTGFDSVFLQTSAPVTLDMGTASIEWAQGNAGFDTFNAAGQTSAVYIYGMGDGDGLTGSPFGDFLDGGDGADTLLGGDGNDLLFGNAGSDVMLGQGGDDSLIELGGDSQIDGGAGFDSLFVWSDTGMTLDLATVSIEWVQGSVLGDDTLNGAGNTVSTYLYGWGGADVLTGGSGNDYIAGGTGNDTMIGGAGHDTMIGEAGVDRYVYITATWGSDTIHSFDPNGEKLDFTAVAAIDSFADFSTFEWDPGNLGYNSTTLFYTDGSTTSAITLIGVQVASLSDSDFLFV